MSWGTQLIGQRAVVAVVVTLSASSHQLLAQDSTGVLVVSVFRQKDSLPLPGAFVRTGRIAAVTNEAGVARLQLAPKLWSVDVTHPSHQPTRFEMTVLAGVSQRAEMYLAATSGDLDDRLASVTRLAGPLSTEPLPVTLYRDATVVRALQRRPGDLLGLFAGSVARAEAISGALDATRLRIRGLPGHYTGLMVDGFPVAGGRSGGFALLQLSPSDLAGAELLSGAASPLHGPTAASGALNLISRRPDRDRVRLLLDQSSEKGGDVAFWGARRFSPTAAGTLSVDFHQQRLVDADDDGWGEFPRAIRLAVRPRLYLDRPNGDGVMITAGGWSEDRTGGFLTATNDPNPYREERRTARGDFGIGAHRVDRQGGRLELRLAGATQSTSHRFDALRERDRRHHAFAEANYQRPVGGSVVVAGASFSYEALRQRDLPAFDFTHRVPSAFTRVVLPFGREWVGSLSGRCDRHNLHGLQCMPWASLLYRRSERFEARFSIGDGYYAPTPLTDEVETLGLHATLPVAARAERVRTASLDFNVATSQWSVALSTQYARVASPVRLVPFPGDPERRLRLLNLSQPTRVFSADLSAQYEGRSFTVRGFYGLLEGSEGIPGASGRRELALSPSHSAGGAVTWRPIAPAAPIATLELNYTGSQSVYDNPYLTRTPDYLLVHGLASLRSGRATLYLNGENLTDRKLGLYHAVRLPAPGDGGRRTVTPWVPLRGRVISIGALVDW